MLTRFILMEWCRTWHGEQPQVLRPAILDLAAPAHLQFLLVMLGNGEFEDVCIETEGIDANEAIRGALTGTGRAERSSPADPAIQASRLFRVGYDVYAQDDRGLFFVNPEPRPELFVPGALERYLDEFKS